MGDLLFSCPLTHMGTPRAPTRGRKPGLPTEHSLTCTSVWKGAPVTSSSSRGSGRDSTWQAAESTRVFIYCCTLRPLTSTYTFYL